MALFKIFKGKSENLGRTGGTDKAREGYAYFTPDDGKFYIDIANSDEVIVGDYAKDGVNRICINGTAIDNDHILFDCGTAAGWADPTSYILDGGDADVTDETQAIVYNAGDSDLSDEALAPVLNAGNSYYNI